MRGRKPKPTAQQIAEGDPRKHGIHKLEERLAAEPKATVGLPKCPSHLKGRARIAWRYWREELEAMDLDRRPDAMMLEGACMNYARAVEAEICWQVDGMIVEESMINEAGEAVVLKRREHPAVKIAVRSWTAMRQFCSEFGLSPLSRTRLSIGKEGPQEDDLAALLMRPREKPPVTVN